MAVVQISRIQHRRGLYADVPQLAAGELGWALDEQRLFIGNGPVTEGAPAAGNTEILTSGSNLFDHQSVTCSSMLAGYGDSIPGRQSVRSSRAPLLVLVLLTHSLVS